MEFKLSFNKAKTASSPDVLIMEGLLNIQHIQAIKKSLQQKVKECQALKVKVLNAESVDFSFLQFLLALKLDFKSDEKPISFELQLKEEQEQLLLRGSGFAAFLTAKN